MTNQLKQNKETVLQLAKEMNVLFEDCGDYIKLIAPKGFVFMANNRHETITDVEIVEEDLWNLLYADLEYGISECSEDTCESFADEFE